MKTFVGMDYHKRYSFATIMGESGEILEQGRLSNSAEAVMEFLGAHAGADCSAVLEATRNWWVSRHVDAPHILAPLVH